MSSRVLELIEDLKVKGNSKFSASAFEDAIECYQKAIQFANKVHVAGVSENETLQKKKLALYLNLAQAQNKISNFQGACGSCGEALQIEAGNAKALYRRAFANKSQPASGLQRLHNLRVALEDLKTAQKTEPQNKEVRELMKTIQSEMKRLEPSAAVNYSGMFKKWKAANENDTPVSLTQKIVEPDIVAYAGLQNEGATCYLNSFLQMIYHITAFRSAFFEVDTSGVDARNPDIILALQRLFFRMSVSVRSRSTRELCMAFGWSLEDTFAQQDIQEFAAIFFDIIENKFKGTPADGMVQKLFGGHMSIEMTCRAIPDYKNVSKDHFLSLYVHGIDQHRNLISAMKAMCLPEDIENFEVSGHGKQTISRRQVYANFGPVLLISLNRVIINPYRGAIKYNGRFEFPESFNIKEVCDGDEGVYHLVSVISHTGALNLGHYVAFVKPLGQSWIKFNDERVSVVSKEEAINNNFGGSDGFMSSCASAYVLCYVRQSELDRLMSGDVLTNIPTHVSDVPETDASGKVVAALPRKMNVSWPGPSHQNTKILRGENFVVPVPAAASTRVGVLLDNLTQAAQAKGLDISPPTSDRKWSLVLTEVYNHHVRKVHTPSTLLSHINHSFFLRAEWAPDITTCSEKWMAVTHAELLEDDDDRILPFGDPFFLLISDTERSVQLLERIKQFCNLDVEEEMQLLWWNQQHGQIIPLQDHEVVLRADRLGQTAALIVYHRNLGNGPDHTAFLNQHFFKQKGVTIAQ